MTIIAGYKLNTIQILRCLIELPILWNHIKATLSNPRFFAYLLRNVGRYRIMFLLIVYILSPFDILPESLLGILGLVDDIIICVIVMAMISQATMSFIRQRP
jgi:RING finger protein 170